MVIFITIFKMSLRFLYFFLKLLPVKDKILFMSRQNDDPSIDYIYLIEELKKRSGNYEIMMLCKRMKNDYLSLINYYFYSVRQMYHLATSKVCIVDGYIITVSILKHKKNLRIIQLWHSPAAIKKFGFQTLCKESNKKGILYERTENIARLMDMHKNYNVIVSGSKEMVPYFSQAFNQPMEKFISPGIPRFDYLLEKGSAIKHTLFKKYPKLSKKKNILFVPTFRSDKNVEVEQLVKHVDFGKYNLIINEHPRGKKNKMYGNVLYLNEKSLDLITIADHIITDYSAISVEAALIDKKIYFYLYDYEEYLMDNGLNVNLMKDYPNLSYRSGKELLRDISNDVYDYNEFTIFKNKYANSKGNSTKEIIDFIIKEWM